VQTWNEELIFKNDAKDMTERGLPQTADKDRSSSKNTFPPICSKEGRQFEEERKSQARKKETKIEERRQESGRVKGFTNNFQSTNICIDRLSTMITYRGGGEAETARGSRKPSCSSSSASPHAPQSPTSSSTSVEQATRSPLIGRRSPSPVNMTGRTMSADKCRGTLQLSGGTKTTEAAATYGGNNTLGGKMQLKSGQPTREFFHLPEEV
jgi:hypothetical protein